MPERNEKLYEWEKHKTPKGVAEYMRDQGRTVGRKYETHGDVWQANDAIVQTGLLHLILDKLEQMQERSDPMEGHQEWLEHWHGRVTKAVAEHEKQKARLLVMFGADANLGADLRNYFDVHRSSRLYRRDSTNHLQAFERLEEKIKRMRSVRKPEDVENLEGIGEKKALKILQKMQTKSM